MSFPFFLSLFVELCTFFTVLVLIIKNLLAKEVTVAYGNMILFIAIQFHFSTVIYQDSWTRIDPSKKGSGHQNMYNAFPWKYRYACNTIIAHYQQECCMKCTLYSLKIIQRHHYTQTGGVLIKLLPFISQLQLVSPSLLWLWISCQSKIHTTIKHSNKNSTNNRKMKDINNLNSSKTFYFCCKLQPPSQVPFWHLDFIHIPFDYHLLSP